jgi:ribosomal protein S18 acetylase RimI-like enzyme
VSGLFVSCELAARIEAAECRLLRDGTAAFVRRGADCLVQPLAGGIAVFTVPGSPLNKIAGLGFSGPLDPAELAGIERACAERGMPVLVEVSTLADPSIAAMLSGRGYVLRGFENVLGRALPAEIAMRADCDVEVARSDDDELATWIDVAVTGFATPDLQGVASPESYPRELIEPVIADFARTEGFVRYLARRGGAPVAAASMRTHRGIAQLCGAATLPEHRRRGAQTALLARRLADAAEAGCDVAVLTAMPGSKSHENAQLQGFALLYARAVLVCDQPRAIKAPR